MCIRDSFNLIDNNFLRYRPNYFFAFFLLLSITLQLVALFLQQRKGALYVVPRCLRPKTYDYTRRIEEVDTISGSLYVLRRVTIGRLLDLSCGGEFVAGGRGYGEKGYEVLCDAVQTRLPRAVFGRVDEPQELLSRVQNSFAAHQYLRIINRLLLLSLPIPCDETVSYTHMTLPTSDLV
eukprot:TRINITY_DN9455_c0_g6_i1.p1 TRINITY_DN9455_c0_g6~~TRINITY_DN9455_c0_g6_i1.p1  ORF type:complete len:179 (+),score=7.08 TRINITY_DN9455_c0_g6_i1:73-609(+)